MKRTYLALLCAAIIFAGLESHRGVVSIAGLGGFWLAMLPRPRAVAVYSNKRTAAISRSHTSTPSAVKEHRA